MRNARDRFKDILRDVKSNGTLYELEVAAERVERNQLLLTSDNEELGQKRYDIMQKEVKAHDNRRTAHRTLRKLVRQIRGHVKPNSAKKSGLMRVEIELRNDVWKQLTGKEELEEYIIARNVEQFSHTGAMPFGYTPLGNELGYTSDSYMVDDIHNGTLYHEALDDEAINAIVTQLRKHPAIQQIILPIVTEEDFKSAFKGVPEKTASSYSGRGVHHYKACSEGSHDGTADLVSAVHAAMMTVPLSAGFCPEKWKQSVDLMLEKIPGVPRSNKLRIIQLLEVDLNQILRIMFARNISLLAKEQSGIFSEHQYRRANKT
jgi:hypothetical protein